MVEHEFGEFSSISMNLENAYPQGGKQSTNLINGNTCNPLFTVIKLVEFEGHFVVVFEKGAQLSWSWWGWS